MTRDQQPRIEKRNSLDAFLDSDEDDKPARPTRSSTQTRSSAAATLKNHKGPVVGSSDVLNKAKNLLERGGSQAPRGASPSPLSRGASPSPQPMPGGGSGRPQSAGRRGERSDDVGAVSAPGGRDGRHRAGSQTLNPGDVQRGVPSISLTDQSGLGLGSSRLGPLSSPVGSPQMNRREIADEYGGTAKALASVKNPMTSIGPAIPGVGPASPSMGGSRQNSLRSLGGGGRDASPAPSLQRGHSPSSKRGRQPSADKRTNEMGFTVDGPSPALTTIGPGLSAMPTTQGKPMGSRAPSRGLSPVPSPKAENRGASPAPRQKPGEGPLAGLGTSSMPAGALKSPLSQLAPASPSMGSRGGVSSHSMTSIGPGPLSGSMGSRQGSAQGNISMTTIGPPLGGQATSASSDSKTNPGGLTKQNLSMLDVPKLQGMGSRQPSLSSLASEDPDEKGKKSKKDKKDKKHKKDKKDKDDDPLHMQPQSAQPLRPQSANLGLKDIPPLSGMGSRQGSVGSLSDRSELPEKKNKKDKKEKKSKKHGKHEDESPKVKDSLSVRPPLDRPLASLDPSKLSRDPSLESLISERSEAPFGSEKKSKKEKKEKKSKKHAKDDDPLTDNTPAPIRPGNVLNALDKDRIVRPQSAQLNSLDPKKLSRQPSLESDISEVPSVSGKKSKKEKKEKKSKKHKYDDEELLDGSLDDPLASKSTMGGPDLSKKEKKGNTTMGGAAIDLGDSLEDVSDHSAIPEKKKKKDKKEKKSKKHAKDEDSFDIKKHAKDEIKDDDSFDSLLDATDFGPSKSTNSKFETRGKDNEAICLDDSLDSLGDPTPPKSIGKANPAEPSMLDDRRFSSEIEEVTEPQVPARPQSAAPSRPQSAAPSRPQSAAPSRPQSAKPPESDSVRATPVQNPPTNTAQPRPFAGRSVNLDDESISDSQEFNDSAPSKGLPKQSPASAMASTMASSGGLSASGTAPKAASSAGPKSRPQTAPPRPQPERPQSSAGGAKPAHKAEGLRVSRFLLCFEPPVLAVDWGKDPKLLPPDSEQPKKTRTHIELTVDELADVRDRAWKLVQEHDFLSGRHLWSVEGLLRQLAARSLPVYRVVCEKGAVLQDSMNDTQGWGQVPHLPRGALVLARERARQMNGWWIKVWSGQWMQESCTKPGAEEVSAERCQPTLEEVNIWLKTAMQSQKPTLEQNAAAVAKQAGLNTPQATGPRRPGTAPPRAEQGSRGPSSNQRIVDDDSEDMFLE